MAPAVKRVLPPASASGARSSMVTRAPRSAAATAAANAAFPAPTTTTSVMADLRPPPRSVGFQPASCFALRRSREREDAGGTPTLRGAGSRRLAPWSGQLAHQLG